MGQILGIFAKNKSGIINKSPIYAEEESHYSLANIFMNPKKYVTEILEKSKLEESRKNWLQISDEEETALLYNNVQDFAEDEIQYRKSVNEPLPNNFRAIKMEYEASKGEIIYAEDYTELENWSKVQTTIGALYKIKEVLYEDLKSSIQKGEDDEYKKYSFDNIHILYSIAKMMKFRENANEIALVYAPY